MRQKECALSGPLSEQKSLIFLHFKQSQTLEQLKLPGFAKAAQMMRA